MVVIGAGECGVRAALALREHGFDGPVTLLGAERHAPYERPPMSKHLMLAEAPLPPKTIASVDQLAALDIAFLPDTSVSSIEIDRQEIVTDNSTILYDRLLLATGARPRRIDGATGPHMVVLRTYDDALRIRNSLHRRERMVIVGGGFIGLELAAAGRCVGADITVVEALPRLLARGVPEALAATLEARHRAEGVKFHLGASVAGFGEDRVALSDGTALPADLIVIGIGSLPATELAMVAGLVIDNGIAVDNRLRTSHPNIFAAGDCCSFPLDLYRGRRVRLESWRNAQEQGKLAARNMLGADEVVSSVPWFWSDQYDLVLQIAGLQDEGRSIVTRDIEAGRILFHLADDGRLVAASGLGTGNAVARDIRLAEMLIARRARPKPQDLASPRISLKALLREDA
ncbi:MAG: FAD-dependent oxidoreductase [Devosia sp.]